MGDRSFEGGSIGGCDIIYFLEESFFVRNSNDAGMKIYKSGRK